MFRAPKPMRMLEILRCLFSVVCGQDPSHAWAPGGLVLPCCQRCAGLYVGAGIAALAHALLRPKPMGHFLELHGSFLLLMVPFGFHWVPQGDVLRTITGALFGFGVVAFLLLPLNAASRSAGTDAAKGTVGHGAYWALLCGTSVLLPLVCAYGGPLSAYALSAAVLGGAIAVMLLVFADVLLGIRGMLRWGRAFRQRWSAQ